VETGDLVKLLPAQFAIKLAEIHAGFCDLFNLSNLPLQWRPGTSWSFFRHTLQLN
jgi:hypothetical protein